MRSTAEATLLAYKHLRYRYLGVLILEDLACMPEAVSGFCQDNGVGVKIQTMFASGQTASDSRIPAIRPSQSQNGTARVGAVRDDGGREGT